MRTQRDAIEIFKKVNDACSILFGEKLSDTILYGAYARGDQHEYSDFNILILADLGDEELSVYRSKVAVVASDMSLEEGVTVSIAVKSEEQFKRYVDVVPLYNNIIREGIKYADIVHNQRFRHNGS